MRRIQAAAVVIPAHDEQDLLPACLLALRRAARELPVPLITIVVLDRCRDATAAVVARFPEVGVLRVEHRNVGRTRAAGLQAAVARYAGTVPAARLWLASTDADSQVPDHWWSRQLRLAEAGADMVVGTVRVGDWAGHPGGAAQRFAARYQQRDDHPHVHGANLGLTAAAYRASGGMPPLAVHEDRELVAAVTARGYLVVRTAGHPVLTSSRRDPRARGGFGDHLRDLAG